MDQMIIKRDTYFDSVFLMSVSAELGKLTGLTAGFVVLATEANRALLTEQGFDPQQLAALGPTDLICALRADDNVVLEQAQARVASLLAAAATSDTANAAAERPVGLAGGLAQLPDANLALISVPGQYAAFESRRALERGLHVMLFSDNVSLEQEISLKEHAAKQGLLVMGPDCGTAMIGGIPLGFANRVRSGSIGLVGASGTGLQEISCQLHRLGSGVSHMLGTGGRDLTSGVGARTTLAAIDLLAEDPATQILVVVSKPPAKDVSDRVLRHLEQQDKPAVVCFLGQEEVDIQKTVQMSGTLRETAWLAHCLATDTAIGTTQPYDAMGQEVSHWVEEMSGEQRYLHGLFTGGTLAWEALLILRREGQSVWSNLDQQAGAPPADSHSIIDLGADEFTRGRPHPMIDPAPRNELIVQRGGDPSTALILLDLVLGTGCHPDPASITARAVDEARKKNPGLMVVASVTGTDLDAQNLSRQRATLKGAGALVLHSNVGAASFAARVTRAMEQR